MLSVSVLTSAYTQVSCKVDFGQQNKQSLNTLVLYSSNDIKQQHKYIIFINVKIKQTVTHKHNIHAFQYIPIEIQQIHG